MTSRNHPNAAGLPDQFELEHEEMYSEPFGVLEPQEIVFIQLVPRWRAFRSGLTYWRGAGNIIYFCPGHDTCPTYHDANVQRVLQNAVRWAHNPAPRLAQVNDAPSVPVDQALEPITERGSCLHQDGEEGFK